MLKDLVAKNRSYRSYDQGVEISRQQLEDIVDAARLTPFSQNFQAFKYYLSCDKETNALIQPLTGWARWLQPMQLPPEGHCPTAFVVICYDQNIGPGAKRFEKDIGTVAQTMLLRAVEMGLGGIMIGNFSPEKVSQALQLDEHLQPVLIVAFGKPDEEIVLTEIGPDGDIKYFRDENNVHHVPKRSLEDLIING